MDRSSTVLRRLGDGDAAFRVVCSAMSGELLIVAASAPDFAGLRAHIGERLDGTIRNVPVRTKVLGLGMSTAAAGAARGILAVEPRAVILLGTCGVFPGLAQYRPLDLVIPSRIHAVDPLVLQGRAEFATPMQTMCESHPMMVAGLIATAPRAHGTPLASTLGRISEDALAATMHAASGCDSENPEAFGVAAACSAARVPFVAVLGVTNLVGSTGRQDWGQFQREAVTQAANAVANWLHTGAQGLPH